MQTRTKLNAQWGWQGNKWLVQNYKCENSSSLTYKGHPLTSPQTWNQQLCQLNKVCPCLSPVQTWAKPPAEVKSSKPGRQWPDTVPRVTVR